MLKGSRGRARCSRDRKLETLFFGLFRIEISESDDSLINLSPMQPLVRETTEERYSRNFHFFSASNSIRDGDEI